MPRTSLSSIDEHLLFERSKTWKFYRLTDEGRRFLDDHNHLRAEEALQRTYETITDKPEKMVKYENAPRPEVA